MPPSRGSVSCLVPRVAVLVSVLGVALIAVLIFTVRACARLRAAQTVLSVAAEAAREAEERWRSAVNVVGGVLIGVRPDLTIFEWNPAAETLYGLARDQVVGQDFLRAAVPSEGREEACDDLARAFAGRPVEGEERFVTDARGRPRLLSWQMRRVTDAHGHVVGAILGGIDVTELHASAKRFSLLFELSSDAHVLFDASGTIDCNQTALRLIGAQDKLQLAGVKPFDLAPAIQPNGLQSAEAAFMAEALARRHGHHRLDWTLQSFDGHPIPVEMTLTPVPFEGTEVMLAVLHDLSQRRAAEEAERTARVQMLEVIDAVDSGFAMYDAHERLVLCNIPYRAMLDLDSEHLRAGILLPDILRAALSPRPHESSKVPDERLLADVLQRHRIPGPAFDVRLGDTTQRVTVQRTHDKGLVVTHTDITVIRNAQHELERSRHLALTARESADHANRAKSAFLTAISRELRTPLHTIIGFSRYMRRNDAGNLAEVELSYLDRIEWNGRHVLSLIDNLHDISKIESGEIQANRTAVDLEACVRATVATLEEGETPSTLAIRIQAPEKLASIESDPAKIQQLVRHLFRDISARARAVGHGVLVTIRANESGIPTSIEMCSERTDIDLANSPGDFAPPKGRAAADEVGFELALVRALCSVLNLTLDVSTLDDGRRRLIVYFRNVSAKTPNSAHAA